MKGSDLPLRIAVVGLGSAGPFEEVAEEVGAEIARRGAWLVCGGLGGVMEAASRGAHRYGGVTVGILPDSIAVARKGKGLPNKFISLPIFTGRGGGRTGRNEVLINTADSVIALPGSNTKQSGTRSEIELAIERSTPLVVHPFWKGVPEPILEAPPLIQYFESPADAVAKACGEIH